MPDSVAAAHEAALRSCFRGLCDAGQSGCLVFGVKRDILRNDDVPAEHNRLGMHPVYAQRRAQLVAAAHEGALQTCCVLQEHLRSWVHLVSPSSNRGESRCTHEQ